MLKRFYFLIATILITVLMLGSVNFVYAAGDKDLTDDEKAAFIVRDEWTGWVKDFTASLSELDQIATAKIYDDMDFYDMQYRFTEKYKKVPEYLDEEGKPTQKLKDMIKKKRKKIAGAKSRDFLCFTSKANGVTVRLDFDSSLSHSFGKSSDGLSFTSWDGTTAVTLNSGDKLYVWNKNETLSIGMLDNQYFRFNISGGDVEVSGDVASMINFSEPKAYCFFRLFYNQTSIVSCPEVSSTTTAPNCYMGMFHGCTNIKTGPSDLPATNVASSAYCQMFEGCSKLETAPLISAKTMGSGACSQMFYNCVALTKAPDLPAATLASDSYERMFFGCTELKTAPSTLPALTVPQEAYEYMFHNCSKLTKSPIIKARNLNSSCFQYMFYGCSALNEIHLEEYTGSFESSYFALWVSGVSSTGTFYYGGAGEPRGDSAIPDGWTVVHSN